jgi:hypothetical protein
MNPEGMNCTRKLNIPRFYVTIDFKQGMMMTAEQNADILLNNNRVVRTYCMEWIKHE